MDEYKYYLTEPMSESLISEEIQAKQRIMSSMWFNLSHTDADGQQAKYSDQCANIIENGILKLGNPNLVYEMQCLIGQFPDNLSGIISTHPFTDSLLNIPVIGENISLNLPYLRHSQIVHMVRQVKMSEGITPILRILKGSETSANHRPNMGHWISPELQGSNLDAYQDRIIAQKGYIPFLYPGGTSRDLDRWYIKNSKPTENIANIDKGFSTGYLYLYSSLSNLYKKQYLVPILDEVNPYIEQNDIVVASYLRGYLTFSPSGRIDLYNKVHLLSSTLVDTSNRNNIISFNKKVEELIMSSR